MTIFLSAGEASGDRYGAMLAGALRRLRPGIRLAGLGGPRMAAAGVALVADLTARPVMGWIGAIRHLFWFAGLVRRIRGAWAARPPAAVVLIDYPGLNLRLAAAAKARRVPSYYWVCPQVWAWGENRLLAMRANLRRCFPALPFEEPFHQAYGVASSFLGHPLLEILPTRFSGRAAALRRVGLDPQRPIACLLPGSRPSEIMRLLPDLTATASLVWKQRRDVQWMIIAAPGMTKRIQEMLVHAGVTPTLHVAEDPHYDIRHHAAFALVASGTASLELGLLGVPHAVVYRSSWLDYQIVRWLVRTPAASLVNLILKERVVMEWVQHMIRPDVISRHALALQRPAARSRARAVAAELRRRLGPPGATARVARAILADIGA